MDHTLNLPEHVTCRCTDPLCGGIGRPRRPRDYIAKSPSGTFRNSAYHDLARIEARAERKRRRMLDQLRKGAAQPTTKTGQVAC